MMVSSKFGGFIPPFQVPPVCRKPTPPGGDEPPENPDPTDPLAIDYNYDVIWLGQRYKKTGTLQFIFILEWQWATHLDPPTNGPYYYFAWFDELETISCTGAVNKNGIPQIAFTYQNQPYPPNPNFDTGVFEFGPAWPPGIKEGRVYNA